MAQLSTQLENAALKTASAACEEIAAAPDPRAGFLALRQHAVYDALCDGHHLTREINLGRIAREMCKNGYAPVSIPGVGNPASLDYQIKYRIIHDVSVPERCG